MFSSRLMPNGWLRLPREIRRSLDMRRGDRLELHLQGNEVVIRSVRRVGASEKLFRVVAEGDRPLTIEEIEDATMEAFEKRQGAD